MPDFEEILNESEEQEENTLLWIALGLSFAVDIFVPRILREIEVLRGTGVTNTAIANILRNDLATNGRIFGEFRNSLKRGIAGGIMQSFRVGQDNIYGDRIKLKWISVGSPKICIDCESRIGQIKGWEEWKSIGLPASGFSVCKENCYCQLVPSNVEILNPVIVEVSGAESTR